MTILRSLSFRNLLLAWAELTIADCNSDTVFSEVGQIIHMHGPNNPGFVTVSVKSKMPRPGPGHCLTSVDITRSDVLKLIKMC